MRHARRSWITLELFSGTLFDRTDWQFLEIAFAFQDPGKLTKFVYTGTRPAARANAAAKAVVKGSSVRLSIPISVTEPNGSNQIDSAQKY